MLHTMTRSANGTICHTMTHHPNDEALVPTEGKTVGTCMNMIKSPSFRPLTRPRSHGIA